MNPDINVTVTLPAPIQVSVSQPSPVELAVSNIGGPQGEPGADGAPGPAGTTDYNELTNTPTLGTAAATASTDYATAAQGTKADTAVQPATLTTGLATKADSVHTHSQADVSSLVSDLAAKQATLVSGTNIKTINGTSVLGSGDLSIASGATEAYIKSRQVYSVIVGSTNADYTYDGNDIAVAINAAIADAPTTGIDIYVKAGTYTIATPIQLNGKANLRLRGAGKDHTIFEASSGDFTFINAVNASYRYKFRIADLSLDNTTATPNSIGIAMGLLSDSELSGVVVKNFGTGYKLSDGMFYNSFYKCDTENCINAITLSAGSTDVPNSNTFMACKLLADSSFVNVQNSASTNVNTLTINAGNQNTFLACQFENFNTAITIGSIGNSITNCRIESNDVTDSSTYIFFTTNGKNNQLVGNYYSGNDWVSRSVSIINSGAGNSFIEGNTYKDQFVIMERNLIGSDDFITYNRTGSGDGKAVVIASDSYAASGTPIQFQAKGVRAAGKFFQGSLSGTENFYVNGSGQGYFAGGLLINSQRIQNVANPTSAQDAVTKSYVDNPAQWTPSNYGFISWAYDLAMLLNTTQPSAGVAQVIKLRTPVATTISNIHISVGTAGVALSNCYVALYQNSSLLAQSSDQSSNWISTGFKTITITPQAVAAGTVDVVFWVGSATTIPAFSRSSGTSGSVGGLTGTNLRWSTADTGLTTTAPATLGARTTSVVTLWAAVS